MRMSPHPAGSSDRTVAAPQSVGQTLSTTQRSGRFSIVEGVGRYLNSDLASACAFRDQILERTLATGRLAQPDLNDEAGDAPTWRLKAECCFGYGDWTPGLWKKGFDTG